MTTPYNVLAERYASSAMVALWGPEQKVILERQLWVAALTAQMELNPSLGITLEDVEAYKAVIERVDLASIEARELRTKHDVKARIEEFNALAGGRQLIHRGFTSRDLTDNVELLQMRKALRLLQEKTVAVLWRLGQKARECELVIVCGRTHNVAAQATTLGKRFATIAEELLFHYHRLYDLLDWLPLRGIKGPVGTQQDMVDLLGSSKKAEELERRIMEHLGFNVVLSSVGQVYPRSIDYTTVSTLFGLASAPANFANLIRLMAGHGLMHEGFSEEQSGSSAMPHKVNSRTCERINSIMKVLTGTMMTTACLAGDQWYEGDVSCSAARRVALADACYALDGIYESMLTVLKEMEIFHEAIATELLEYLPFLSTTALLLAATKQGLGREEAHALIKRHALAANADMRRGANNTLIERLAGDPGYPLDLEAIERLIKPETGLALSQVQAIVKRIDGLCNRFEGAKTYEPDPIR